MEALKDLYSSISKTIGINKEKPKPKPKPKPKNFNINKDVIVAPVQSKKAFKFGKPEKKVNNGVGYVKPLVHYKNPNVISPSKKKQKGLIYKGLEKIYNLIHDSSYYYMQKNKKAPQISEAEKHQKLIELKKKLQEEYDKLPSDMKQQSPEFKNLMKSKHRPQYEYEEPVFSATILDMFPNTDKKILLQLFPNTPFITKKSIINQKYNPNYTFDYEKFKAKKNMEKEKKAKLLAEKGQKYKHNFNNPLFTITEHGKIESPPKQEFKVKIPKKIIHEPLILPSTEYKPKKYKNIIRMTTLDEYDEDQEQDQNKSERKKSSRKLVKINESNERIPSSSMTVRKPKKSPVKKEVKKEAKKAPVKKEVKKEAKKAPVKKEVKKQEPQKECPKGKIYNPNTNRCVNIDGKIGKALLTK